MPRPITQRQRRQQIIDTAIALLAEDESREVGIADVARRLNLTPNAIRYYYRDGDALLWAIREKIEQRFLIERSESVARLDDPRQKLMQLVSSGLPTGPEDAEWRVVFRPVMNQKVTVEYGEMLSDMFDRQVTLYHQVILQGTESTVFSPHHPSRDIATLLMVMEDYLGFRIVSLDPLFDRSVAIRLIRDYATAALKTTLPQIT